MGGPERRPGSRPTAESGGPDNAKRIKMEETNRKGHVSSLFYLIVTGLNSALRARLESSSGLTSSTPMVRTHTLDPTPDAPRSYNPPPSHPIIN